MTSDFFLFLLSVSEEVRSRCHLKHKVPPLSKESPSTRNFTLNTHQHSSSIASPNVISEVCLKHNPSISHSHLTPIMTPLPSPSSIYSHPSQASTVLAGYSLQPLAPSNSTLASSHASSPLSSRQKSWDNLNHSSSSNIDSSEHNSQDSQRDSKSWKSLDIDGSKGLNQHTRAQRSSSVPTPRTEKAAPEPPYGFSSTYVKTNDYSSETAFCDSMSHPQKQEQPNDIDTQKSRESRVSVSNEDNVLLDPEVLTEFTIQALVLTVLVRRLLFSSA